MEQQLYDKEDSLNKALEIIHEMLQKSSYTDSMHNVMFKLPLPLVNKAEQFLTEENFYQKKYGNIQENK